MVGTTTKATARQVSSNGALNPAAHAAILAAAAVAQVTLHSSLLLSVLPHTLSMPIFQHIASKRQLT
ncbi:hypothetical protein B5X24_HaOG211143 [Helicoverpa armigera]|uniref:Uncharacterized protein n=1 Tax=Helicoverpa armigera TaxID=29058 RepID=A0A2W1BBU6_HELAM|nr:hypothetical protein B5X24_HaOG211143 [Helicoverpa armigera]